MCADHRPREHDGKANRKDPQKGSRNRPPSQQRGGGYGPHREQQDIEHMAGRERGRAPRKPDEGGKDRGVGALHTPVPAGDALHHASGQVPPDRLCPAYVEPLVEVEGVDLAHPIPEQQGESGQDDAVPHHLPGEALQAGHGLRPGDPPLASPRGPLLKRPHRPTG